MADTGVDTRHPSYEEMIEDWETVRDCADGERKIKEAGVKYLPTTSGMRDKGLESGQEGAEMYSAYVKRAVFPDLVRPAVNALIGVMHREPADIQLPEGMEDIRENATLNGESLLTLLRRINEAQLLTGRIGLLADVPKGGPAAVPFIATYEAENIINWDESRRPSGRKKPDLIVLDESEQERTSEFGWDLVKKYLVLDLVNALNVQPAIEGDSETPAENARPELRSGQVAMYRSRLFRIEEGGGQVDAEANRQTQVQGSRESRESVGEDVFPQMRGQTLEEIPFVFVGSIDLTTPPDQIPMKGLANLSLTIYRGEADYRQTLFLQGQDTLVVTGDISDPDKPKKRMIGANTSIELPIGGTASMLGQSSDGLAEQREAIQNDRDRASELGANLLSSTKGGNKEAEETLVIRVSARTASITTVVKAGAEGLQAALRIIAVWRGLDPEEVVVTPNMDFVGDKLDPKSLVDLMTAKSMGLILSDQSIHKYMKDNDLTALTFEEEIALIEKEKPIGREADEEEAERRRQEDRQFLLSEMRAERELRGGGNTNEPGNTGNPTEDE